MSKKFLGMFAALLTVIAALSTTASAASSLIVSPASVFIFLYQPKAPKSLLR